MKILFFIDCLTSGGKERRLIELLKSLVKIPEIRFELILMSKEIHYKEIHELNIKIHYIIRKSKKDPGVFLSLYKICKIYKPDIIHCWDSMTAVYSVPVCKLMGIKLVNGMVTDTLVSKNIFNKSWRRARLTFPFSDIVVGNSLAGLKSYRSPSRRSVCIYNGMDLSRFTDLADPSTIKRKIFGNDIEDLFIVGMVARFEKHKDYRTLINTAISLLAENINIRFILVGGGMGLETIKSLVPDNLSDKILFLGTVNNVESIISIFHAGILLTNVTVHGEGISNSILEYMALAKPVIATKGGGTNELVINGVNGFLINPGSISELKEKIKILIINNELAKKLGDKGRQLVNEKFDIRIMTEKYIELYDSLLKE